MGSLPIFSIFLSCRRLDTCSRLVFFISSRFDSPSVACISPLYEYESLSHRIYRMKCSVSPVSHVLLGNGSSIETHSVLMMRAIRRETRSRAVTIAEALVEKSRDGTAMSFLSILSSAFLQAHCYNPIIFGSPLQ